jgi:hypothetical protein
MSKKTTPKSITKGSTLLATLKSEFLKGNSEDLVSELHQMIAKALKTPVPKKKDEITLFWVVFDYE